MSKMLFTNANQILVIVNRITEELFQTKDLGLNARALALRLKQQISESHNNHLLQLNDFLSIGSCILRLMDLEHQNFSTPTFADFLLEKHRKYGAEPILETGMLGIQFRMISKINRFLNMQEQRMRNSNVQTKVDEEDTLSDILGYVVLGYQYLTEPQIYSE